MNEKDDEVDEIEGDVDEECPDIPLAEKKKIYFLGLTFIERFIHAAYRAPWAAEE